MRLMTVALGSCLVVSTSCSDPSREDTERDESGEIAEEGDVGVLRLQVGDCLMLPDSMVSASGEKVTEVSNMKGLPCSDPHNGEVILIDETFYEDYAEDDYPGIDQLETMSMYETCIDAVDAYTGSIYEESAFDGLPMVPTEISWESADDRALVCFGVTYDADLLEVIDTTGSMAAD